MAMSICSVHCVGYNTHFELQDGFWITFVLNVKGH